MYADSQSCKEKYDHYCKRVLSNKDVLARILQHTMKEYQDMPLEEVRSCIEDHFCIFGDPSGKIKELCKYEQEKKRSEYILGAGTEEHLPEGGSIWYDIRFMARQPCYPQDKDKKDKDKEKVHWRQIMVDIEAQAKFWQKRLEPRAVFYGSRMICSQMGRLYKNPQYEKGRKVYSIWICTDSPRRLGNRISHIAFCRNDMHEKQRERQCIKMRYYDKMEIIFIYLNQKEQHKDPLTEFLCILLSKDMPCQKRLNILQGKFGLRLDNEIKEEMREMCNLSEAIERDGIRKGRRQGRKEGLREGKKEGRREGLREGQEKGQLRILSLITKMNGSGEGKLIFRLQEDPEFLDRQLQKYGL